MYYISLERSFYSTSARFCFIKIHAEMAEKSRVNDKCFHIDLCLCIYEISFHIFSLNMDLFRS